MIAALAVAVAVAWPASVLPAEVELPEGLTLGRWIVAPSVFVDFDADDNLLRTDDSQEPVEDRSIEYGGEFGASLPFRNSLFSLAYEASKVGYSAVDFQRELSDEASVELELNLGTGSRLVLRDTYTRDSLRMRQLVSEDSSQDPEETFFGEPWNENRAQLTLERAVPGRQGWRIQLERRDFNYKGTTINSLYDSRGFESNYEYRQPVSNERWFVFYYGMRRFNHYRPEDPVGVPFRKEINDVFQLGWRGYAGPDNPYLIRVGYEKAKFEIESSKSNQISALLTGSFHAGPRSRMNLSLSRQAFASVEDTHYINNRLWGEFQTRALRTLDVRGRMVLAFNQYVDPVETDCGGERREDWVRGLEGEVAWPLEPWLELGMSGTHEVRSSNCEFGDYDDTEFRAGLRLGWF